MLYQAQVVVKAIAVLEGEGRKEGQVLEAEEATWQRLAAGQRLLGSASKAVSG